MPGGPDPAYVRACGVLLDALVALVSRDVTTTAPAYLQDLFGTPASPGVRMLAGALPMEDAGILAASCAALATDLLVEVRRRQGE